MRLEGYPDILMMHPQLFPLLIFHCFKAYLLNYFLPGVKVVACNLALWDTELMSKKANRQINEKTQNTST